MEVLAPIDASDCSFRALDIATELVTRFGGTLHVVHITDYTGESTNQIIQDAERMLGDAGIGSQPEIVTDARMSNPRYANQVGNDILRIADKRVYDHIVMSHHGAGRIGRVVLGSAAETVIRAVEHTATLIP